MPKHQGALHCLRHSIRMQIDLPPGGIDEGEQLPSQRGQRAELRVAVRVRPLVDARSNGEIHEADRSPGPARCGPACSMPEPDPFEVPPGRADNVGLGDLQLVEGAD